VRLGKPSRLLSRREFLAVQERGARLASREYAVIALPNALERPRIGVTVSSRVANAVVRNQVKRWVREAFREAAGELPAVDLVLVARREAAAAGLEGARRALAGAREALRRREAGR
jgi:ribonuclease P protein component